MKISRVRWSAEIDERFQSASAYMVLGQVYCQSPRMLGGDLQGYRYLEKGAKLAPDNALMRIRLAEAYAAANRNGEAKKAIDELLVRGQWPVMNLNTMRRSPKQKSCRRKSVRVWRNHPVETWPCLKL